MLSSSPHLPPAEILVTWCQFLTMRQLVTVSLVCKRMKHAAYHPEACSHLELAHLSSPNARPLLLRWRHPLEVEIRITEVGLASEVLDSRCSRVVVRQDAAVDSGEGHVQMRCVF